MREEFRPIAHREGEIHGISRELVALNARTLSTSSQAPTARDRFPLSRLKSGAEPGPMGRGRPLRVLRLVRTLPTHPYGDHMHRLVGRAPLVGALVFIAGCGTDGGGTGPASIVGSYRLAFVDGAPIPVTLAPGIVTDADRSDVYFGALVLGADGTARMSVCTRHTKEPTVWVTYSDQQARYTLRADALDLAWNGGGTTQARRESDAIAVPYGYNTVTLQLRFERGEPRAPDADPCL